jgi:hypothetical protein
MALTIVLVGLNVIIVGWFNGISKAHPTVR